jgi:hypothetical protein
VALTGDDNRGALHFERRTDVEIITNGKHISTFDPDIETKTWKAQKKFGTGEDQPFGGAAKSQLLRPQVLHAEEDAHTMSVTLRQIMDGLGPRDRQVAELLAEGYEPSEIKDKLKLGRKATYNVIARLRQAVKQGLAPAARVPRVGLRSNSAAGMDRAFVEGFHWAVKDIELGHEMTVEMLVGYGAWVYRVDAKGNRTLIHKGLTLREDVLEETLITL